MNILVTGAAGYIGSALIRALPNHNITIIDNFATERYCSLFNLEQNWRWKNLLGKVKLIQADFTKINLEEYFKGMDVVIHLAAIVDATTSFERIAETYYTNFMGAKKVANACDEAGCKLIYTSTTSVYGNQEGLVDEENHFIFPASPYARSKLMGEPFIPEQYITLRLGTVFGFAPGIRFQTAVNKFCWQASFGQPMTVWKTALHQKRPYLHIDDCVNAIKFVLDKDLFGGNIYNIVTGNFTPMDIIEALLPYFPAVEYELVSSQIMNQISYEVSAKKFENLGFSFKGTLEQGVKEVLSVLNA